MQGIRPNFALHAAKGRGAEVSDIVNRQNRDDIVVTDVDEKADTVLINVGDETWPDRLKAAHPDKIAEVERLGRFGMAAPK